jgi:hypothetical protein
LAILRGLEENSESVLGAPAAVAALPHRTALLIARRFSAGSSAAAQDGTCDLPASV